jgi:hypothetical protein
MTSYLLRKKRALEDLKRYDDLLEESARDFVVSRSIITDTLVPIIILNEASRRQASRRKRNTESAQWYNTRQYNDY